MFFISNLKSTLPCCFLFFSTSVLAEGLITLNPYVSSSISYDDNLYRFSSERQARAVLGSGNQSDIIKRLDLGLQANLQLSRQVISISTNLNDSQFNRNSRLDNTGSANALRWDWQIGSKLHGELAVDKTKAISGFEEIRNTGKNIRTNTRKFASIYWDIHPDWSLYTSREITDLENDLALSRVLNRGDVSVQSGVRYHSSSNTALELAYRTVDSDFNSRTNQLKTLLGSTSNQNEWILNLAWQPSAKTQLSARLSQLDLKRPNSQLSDFSGFNQRWNLGYSLTDKVNLSMSAYRTLSPVDDVISTYVEATGYSISPTWLITSKLNLSSNVSIEKRDFIGNASLLGISQDRDDESIQAGASLQYFPTQHLLMQIQYAGENRTSSTLNAGYQFNNINFLLRYNF
jgi:exopolysaccharide biosynthesis operon protein EpsL